MNEPHPLLLEAIHGYLKCEDADVKFLETVTGMSFTPAQTKMINAFRKQLWCVAAQEGWNAAKFT